MPNFSFIDYVISTQDSYMAKKNLTNQTKPKTKPTIQYHPKLLFLCACKFLSNFVRFAYILDNHFLRGRGSWHEINFISHCPTSNQNKAWKSMAHHLMMIIWKFFRFSKFAFLEDLQDRGTGKSLRTYSGTPLECHIQQKVVTYIASHSFMRLQNIFDFSRGHIRL